MTAPNRETREEWRRDAIRNGVPDENNSWARCLILLDALDAAEEREAEIAATALTVERERDEALERLAAVRALAEDWIPSGDDTAATCGWAITAVLDDQELAAITVKSLGRRCGLDGCADPTCGGNR